MNKFTFQIALVIASCLLVLSYPLYAFFKIYPHFTDIITFEKEVNAKQIATHISKMLVMDSKTKSLTQESITEGFVAVLEEAQVDFDLTKIKIFSASGEVLYSTDDRDVGAVNTNPYFVDIVSKGKIFSNVVHKDEKTMEDKLVQKDVVETYVPLMRNNTFLGAFEIYYDITYSKHSVGKFVTKSRIIIVVISSFLLLCILFISLSAFLYLKRMRRAEKKMQNVMDQVPSLYNISEDISDE